CHRRFVVAVLIAEPTFLPNACRRLIAPKVDAEDFGMREPDGPVMIVVRGAGMPHARQAGARRANQGVEKRPRIVRAEMPAQTLGAVDLEYDLIVGQRQNLAAGELVWHGGVSRSRAARHQPTYSALAAESRLCDERCRSLGVARRRFHQPQLL